MELLPCPFCSGILELHIEKTEFAEVQGHEAVATCTSCGIGIDAGFYGPALDYDSIKEMATKIINTRPSLWQDISSAPTGGVAVLISGYKHDDPRKGRWVSVGYENSGQWYESDGDDITSDDPYYPPTHFQPLPSPPKED